MAAGAGVSPGAVEKLLDAIPAGTSGWIIAVCLVALLLIVVFIQLPKIIDGVRALTGKRAPTETPAPLPGPREQAVVSKGDDMAQVVERLFEQVDTANATNARLQKRLADLDKANADLRVEKRGLEAEVQALTTANTYLRTYGNHYPGGSTNGCSP